MAIWMPTGNQICTIQIIQSKFKFKLSIELLHSNKCCIILPLQSQMGELDYFMKGHPVK